MTADPICLPEDTLVTEAARTMRDRAIGDVLVMTGDRLCGILTDRDLVVRVLAEGADPRQTTVGEICSRDALTVTPGDDAGEAAKTMREKAIRRLPVVDDGRPVGIVSIGDLAVARDPKSALADISAAPANE